MHWGLSNTTVWYMSSNVITSRTICQPWIFIVETMEPKQVIRLCCLFMNVIRETLIFFHHFERTDPRWWCINLYKWFKSSIHEYSLQKPWKRNKSKGCTVYPWMLLGRCVAFRARNAFVVCALHALLFIRTKVSLVICALHAVLLEWGIIFSWCILRGTFRTRNTLVVCALHAVLLERRIFLLFVYFMWHF